MNNLKIKAEENYDAFVMLDENKKYTSSVHCAYYSAYLLSVYSLCTKFGLQYDDIQKDSFGKDSHYFMINGLAEKIRIVKVLDCVDYYKWMSQLKRARKKADYSKDLISANEAEEVKQNIDNIRKLIMNKYI